MTKYKVSAYVSYNDTLLENEARDIEFESHMFDTREEAVSFKRHLENDIYYSDDYFIGLTKIETNDEPLTAEEKVKVYGLTAVKVKDLKKGDYFTRKPVEYPAEKQVYIRGDYIREDKKYWCDKWYNICDGIELKGDTIVYTGFTF